MDLGFKYDSSIFPMRRNHGGFENFHDQPTLIETPKKNMILEIPVTPISCLNQKIYLLGGGYLRLFPYYLISLSLKKLNRQAKKGLVYLHPREIDSSHPRLEISKYRKFVIIQRIGSREGDSRLNRAERQAWVKKSRTERFCACKEVVTVSIRATNSLPP